MKPQKQTIKSILPKLEFVTGVGGNQQLVPAKPTFVGMELKPHKIKEQPFMVCSWGEYGFIFYSQN